MSKCVSCQAELPPQSRFCGACGTTQPSGTGADESENLETIRSNPPAENAPANIPPPPPQSPPNAGGIEKRELALAGQQETIPASNSLPEQPNNPPSGPRPPAFYGDQPQPPNPQQPYSNYQPAPQAPPPYGSGQYGPQSQPVYGGYQQPYNNYQQPYSNPYGDYPPPPQPNEIYQQPQYPPGVYAANTVASPNTGPAGATPITGPGPQPIPTMTPAPPSRSKPPAWRLWAIIGIVVILILAGTGLVVLLKAHGPSPTISVTSQYYDNGTIAGATDTTLHVTGKQFAANSAITFLLDSTAIRQDMQALSNASGNFTTDLTITSDWSVEHHRLTAHDASNNTTSTSTEISIVQQGYNKTPGLNGSPTNTATFKIATVTHWQSNGTVNTYEPELDITGQSDSQGGSVCAPGDDGSQQKDQFAGPNGTTVTDTYTTTCSGTYKNGHLTYNEALNTDVYTDDGGSCTLTASQSSWRQWTGDYTTSHQFSGTIVENSVDGNHYNCTGDLTISTSSGATGTWTGTVNNS